MQTFLPYSDFKQSVECLDTARLGKQRLECLQLLEAIQPNSRSSWRNHPCAAIWRGYEEALGWYMDCAIREWIARGYKNTMSTYHDKVPSIVSYPPIIGDRKFHDSHKSNLLRKDPVFYGVYNWDVPNNLEYVWSLK